MFGASALGTGALCIELQTANVWLTSWLFATVVKLIAKCCPLTAPSKPTREELRAVHGGR